MAKIKEIITMLEKEIPLESQESWDNSGWQIRLNKKEIKKIMLCVSVTDDVLRQTIEKNCDMIISHHPVMFKKEDSEKPIIKEIIRNHIPMYSLHTPLDKANGGTTDALIKSCRLNADETINEYTKIAYTEITLSELITGLKEGLNIKELRVSNYNPEKILKRVAFCAGSGTSFCEDVENAQCDCFVTADVKYHTAMDFNKILIDVGHLESEKPALEKLKDLLNIVDVEIASEKPILQTV